MNNERNTLPRDMEVSYPWADHIFSGRKKVEVRKDDPNNWGSVMTGDILKIIHKQEKTFKYFKVVDTRVYNTLNECLIAEGIRNLLPGIVSLNDAREIYLGFDGLDADSMKKREEEYNKFGCRAFQLELYVPKTDKGVEINAAGKSCVYCGEEPRHNGKEGFLCDDCYVKNYSHVWWGDNDLEKKDVPYEKWRLAANSDHTYYGNVSALHPSGYHRVSFPPDNVPPSGSANFSKLEKEIPLDFVKNGKFWIKYTCEVHDPGVVRMKLPTSLGVTQIEFGPVEELPKKKLVKLPHGLSVYVDENNAEDLALQRELLTHIQGSSKPEGDPNCFHRDDTGTSWIEYNDDTMGGCGSGWEKMCYQCGKVWKYDD